MGCFWGSEKRISGIPGVLIGFRENHDPTQGDRQGNDIGGNYRGTIYTLDEAQSAMSSTTAHRPPASVIASMATCSGSCRTRPAEPSVPRPPRVPFIA